MSKCDVCLRSEGGVCPSCAPAEIARLRAELEAMKKERDDLYKALALIGESAEKERNEARRAVDAMQSRMNKIAALCEKADEAEWDRAILYFADIFDITEECTSAIDRDEAQITVESSDYDKAAGILRARLRTTKEMKYIAMGFEFKEENEE